MNIRGRPVPALPEHAARMAAYQMANGLLRRGCALTSQTISPRACCAFLASLDASRTANRQGLPHSRQDASAGDATVVAYLFGVYGGCEFGGVGMSGTCCSLAGCVIGGQISRRLRLPWRI
jgi:hypothetical protein